MRIHMTIPMTTTAIVMVVRLGVAEVGLAIVPIMDNKKYEYKWKSAETSDMMVLQHGSVRIYPTLVSWWH